jgi:hypothetical protein
MGLDTKTYWLADRQLQCDSDFDFHYDSVLTSEFLVGDSPGMCEDLVWLEDFIQPILLTNYVAQDLFISDPQQDRTPMWPSITYYR